MILLEIDSVFLSPMDIHLNPNNQVTFAQNPPRQQIGYTIWRT